MGGWPSIFYLFGAVGILWYPYWVYMAYEKPEDHPYMSEEEKAYIKLGECGVSPRAKEYRAGAHRI